MDESQTLTPVLLGILAVLGLAVIELTRRQRGIQRRHQQDSAVSAEQVRTLTKQLSEISARLEALSTVDPLTDVANRRGLERILTAEINRSQRAGSQMVAVLLNCDDFKRINDMLGHAVGDVALREMVSRLSSTLRPSDYIARLGGDEFVVVLTDTQFAEALMIAERIRLAVAENPIRNSSDTIYMTASLGVAPLPYEIASVEEVLSLTRHALEQSKISGKNKVSGSVDKVTGEETPHNETVDVVHLLRQGDCFRCLKHPIVRLADEVKVGYELLTRGPAGAFEMPYDFFRVAIESKMLTRVDLRCLSTCISAASDLEPGLRYDVNLFPSTIIDTPVDRLLTFFPQSKEIGTFCLEISEQQFIGDPSYLKEHTQALQKSGVLVGIDDVGFGRSSLESLILLEPDIVKVDIQYVAGISLDKQKQRLLRRLIGVVGALGAELIAEGIETREDLETVREMGVLYGQGYLWGWPSAVHQLV